MVDEICFRESNYEIPMWSSFHLKMVAIKLYLSLLLKTLNQFDFKDLSFSICFIILSASFAFSDSRYSTISGRLLFNL